MEKIRILSLVFLCFLVLGISCKKTEPVAQAKPDTGGKLKLIYYTDPFSDCITCTNKAIEVLNLTLPDKETIPVYFHIRKRNDEELGYYKESLKKKFPDRGFPFFEYDWKVPHPAIILALNDFMFMYFYIPNDPVLEKESINTALQLFLNFNVTGIRNH
jgi:hypothetical protein